MMWLSFSLLTRLQDEAALGRRDLKFAVIGVDEFKAQVLGLVII
jgi:hypothetical protein